MAVPTAALVMADSRDASSAVLPPICIWAYSRQYPSSTRKLSME
jgi:hypothetical protein